MDIFLKLSGIFFWAVTFPIWGVLLAAVLWTIWDGIKSLFKPRPKKFVDLEYEAVKEQVEAMTAPFGFKPGVFKTKKRSK